MVLMERIVRPHLPGENLPQKVTAKCREEQENKVAKLDAPSGAGSTASPSASKPTEKSRTSSWSHGYKLYMTKKEKEQEKCEPDRVVGGAATTDRKSPEQLKDEK